MKFIDEIVINVEAGKGGDGCLSFRREKYIRRGGPDGGQGGDGGSIFLIGSLEYNTFAHLLNQRVFRAADGQRGRSNNCSGKQGDDLFIAVPLGTKIYLDLGDDFNENCLGEILENGQIIKIASGGEGGLGNITFKNSVNRAPRQITLGKPGDSKKLKLELSMLADVGLLGLPNSGKSTFLSTVSHAKPKIADYQFTTLHPNLGVVNTENFNRFIIADIPGLIPNASQGVGLGIKFLKHLSRTKLLLHLVSLEDFDLKNILDNIKTIETELKNFDKNLLDKPRWFVLTKSDLLKNKNIDLKNLEKLLKTKNKELFIISSIDNIGIKELIASVEKYLGDI